MSERKVLTKYYPPDFDPSAVTRTKRPKDVALKLPTVRLMAPFSMKCASCGEYIYKGRKFNARKQITEEKYYGIPIIRFYIRCTRCSAELTFKTDPKNSDYEAERGIRRNFEPWREAKLAEETEEERLDRLEREEAEKDPMKELEEKVLDAKTEMAIADKLDEIRTRNARLERAGDEREGEPVAVGPSELDHQREREDAEDAEAARRAFQSSTGDKVKRLAEDDSDSPIADDPTLLAQTPAPAPIVDSTPAAPTFVKAKKRKGDFAGGFGVIKKKKPITF